MKEFNKSKCKLEFTTREIEDYNYGDLKILFDLKFGGFHSQLKKTMFSKTKNSHLEKKTMVMRVSIVPNYH